MTRFPVPHRGEQEETEPNDTIATADLITGDPAQDTGNIQPAEEVDVWEVANIPAGHLLFSLVYDNVSTYESDEDPVVTLLDSGGGEIGYFDDSGIGLDAVVPGVPIQGAAPSSRSGHIARTTR